MTFLPFHHQYHIYFRNLPDPFYKSSDFNFVNQYLWHKVVHTEFFVQGDRFILKKEDRDRFRFYFYGNVFQCIEDIQRLSVDKPKHVYLLSSQQSLLSPYYPVQEDNDQHEYLYRYERIRGFQGRLLQKKRNHLHYFHNNYHFRVEPYIDVHHYQDRILLLFTNDEEREAFLQYLSYPIQQPCLLPLAIWIDNEIVAFTLGNIIHDTCIIHFERARKEIRGSYQAVFYYLLEALTDKNIIWINREQDLGLEHLRIAKRSYYPDDYIKKYRLILPSREC
jgi:hypothetical protein